MKDKKNPIITGKFWAYTGNTPGDFDCERDIPDGYTLADIQAVAYLNYVCMGEVFSNPKFTSQFTGDELMRMKLFNHPQEQFGHEITVEAPKSVWDKALAVLYPEE